MADTSGGRLHKADESEARTHLRREDVPIEFRDVVFFVHDGLPIRVRVRVRVRLRVRLRAWCSSSMPALTSLWSKKGSAMRYPVHSER